MDSLVSFVIITIQNVIVITKKVFNSEPLSKRISQFPYSCLLPLAFLKSYYSVLTVPQFLQVNSCIRNCVNSDLINALLTKYELSRDNV
jgi:hypothetical protein